MYLLPESTRAGKEWKEKFNYAGTILDELRGWESEYSESCNDSSGSSFYSSCLTEEDDRETDEEVKLFIPSKFLW